MCGISGIWACDPERWDRDGLAAAVWNMNDALRHRGPDDAGIWCDPSAGVALGHRRLAIIDLSPAGRQPMTGPSGTTHIVFNGEIYNYRELRQTILSDGTTLRSASDTEVILALYEKHGDECLRLLRGMFAFALWDARARRLLIARDRIGKKPLYYSTLGGHLVFASELKALRRILPPDELQLDRASLNRFLSFGFISGPRTIYRNVYQLPPGSMLVATAPDRPQIRSYWTPDDGRVGAQSVTPGEIEEKLLEAVRIRMRSDVPIASFLSGGIDSGLVTAIATRLNGPMSTFTVGFEDGDFDERPLARQVARRLGTDHHEVTVRPDVERLLPQLVRAYDQPYAEAAAVAAYCLAEVVSRHGFKVVLSGDGGDEIFGGYRRALAAAWLSRLEALAGARVIRTAARTVLPLLVEPHPHRSRYAFLRRVIRGAAADEIRRLLIWSTDSFTNDERRDLGMDAYDERGDPEGLASYLPRGADQSPLASMIAIDLRWALPYNMLVKMDVATMAHGLETRSPLLDQELVQMQMERPVADLLPGFSTKPALRAIARKYLPGEVVAAPKRGFQPPMEVEHWVTHELKTVRDELLLATDGLVASMTDRTRLEAFLHRPPAGDSSRWAERVWILLSLAAWDRFVAREDVQSKPLPYVMAAERASVS